MKPLKQLAIVGLGLMGGSLGLAAKRRGIADTVTAYARREETRNAALRKNVADKVFARPADAVRQADVAVFCVPVLATAPLVTASRSGLGKGCLVTDVGSTKEELVSEVMKAMKGSPAAFIGSHPIAGSEDTGIDAAREDLYEGATVVITPLPDTRREVVNKAIAFWESLGAVVLLMSAREHDEVVARTSHLPHLVAATLVNSVFRDDARQARKLCGPGFRDTTRIAAGSADIWNDIVSSNKVALGKELDVFIKTVQHVRTLLDKGDFKGIRSFLANAREKRREPAG